MVQSCEKAHRQGLGGNLKSGSIVVSPINRQQSHLSWILEMCWIIENIPDICHFFYTGKIFGEKIYTEKRVNYDKRISRQSSVNRDLLGKANNKCV